MSSPPRAPNAPPSDDDALVQRYREASELDTARPGTALRETVLAHARSQLGTKPGPLSHTPPAANDAQWKLRALGSLAVVGLIGLLVMQFERGTPEEQELALGQPEQRAERAANAESPQEVGAGSATPAAPAAEEAPATTQAPTAVEGQREPQPAAKASPTPATPNNQPPPADADAAMNAAPRQPALPPPAPSARSMPEAFGQSPPLIDQNTDAPAPPAAAPMPASPAPADKREGSRARREPSALDGAPGAGQETNPRPGLPLHDAVASNQKAKVQQLLNQGVAINARDDQGRTALMLAALGDDPALVELLMNAGADPNLRDHAGWRASDLAEQAGHADWLPLFTRSTR
ncbi:MAG: ankyrin repeat domain-containing protein [Burkholderiaceae bacterium]